MNLSVDLIGIIADDFTGAIDAGVEFVRAGLDTTLLIAPNSGHTAQVEVVTTDSRDGDVATARERVEAAARQLPGRRIFKKIDSTMRGHLGEEITTILRVFGQTKAVVCPAAIEAGRTIRDGELWIHDRRLHHSDFAYDPRWPATTAAMRELVGVPTTHIPLETIRAGVDLLAAAISSASTEIVTVDACDHVDLDLISQAIVLSDALPCGALGLARTWARCQSGQTRALSGLSGEHNNGPILVVAGSRHPRTQAQVQHLLAQGNVSLIEIIVPMDMRHQQEATDLAITALSARTTTIIRALLLDATSHNAQGDLLAALGDLTLRVCQTVCPGALVLTGGETASAMSRCLGAVGVRILGEVEVGVPWGTVIGGITAGSLVVTKAGGFGSEDALSKAVHALNAVRHTA